MATEPVPRSASWRWAPWAAIALLFALSVFLRLPHLGRPLGPHHEWLTSTVLIHQRIWFERGALACRFCPPMSFANPGDRNINNSASLCDAAGRYYYVSYPPLAYIAPYLIFRLVGLYPSPLGIQIFNLFVHLVCVVVIFRTVELLTAGGRPGRGSWPALAAATVYLFSPAPLWYHSNVYMADMFVQPFFLAGIWLFLRLAAREGRAAVNCLLLGLVVFLMLYTEWLGAFFALCAFAFALTGFREARWRGALLAVALGAAAAVALVVWQYSTIRGIDGLLEAWRYKLQVRSGYAETADRNLHVWNLASFRALLDHYRVAYGPALAAAGGLVLARLVAWRRGLLPAGAPEGSEGTRLRLLALGLAAVPALLHHAVFFNFTAVHEFSALKTGAFLALLLGLLVGDLGRLADAGPAAGRPGLRPGLLAALFLLLAAVSAALHLRYNLRGDDRYARVGGEIARVARPEETVFLERPPAAGTLEPQFLFYAHRNVVPWSGEEQARYVLRQCGVSSGVVFTLDSGGRCVKGVRRISL